MALRASVAPSLMAAKNSRSLMASRTVASSGRRWATCSMRSFAFMEERDAESLPEAPAGEGNLNAEAQRQKDARKQMDDP